ncbi:MAG: hypothetical protein LH472_11490 [Pyrinomonadaceae bacterium]|nr:hypothetical protein [Pyrinomonadaceae bacterium]
MKRLTLILSHTLLTVAFIIAANSLAFAQRPTATPTTPKPAETGSTTQTEETSKDGWSYDPDAGFVYRKFDFKLAVAGYGERIFDPDGKDSWRRVRQSLAVEFPRFSKKYRTAFVYEVDLANTNFFRAGAGRKVFENLFFAVQDADDAGKFRALIGENTHIISREDNLSSGNLPTINRSLILEEHGSVNSFGTQFGVQVQKALSPRLTLALSAQDNRGSLNTDNPRYVVGNSLAAKLTGLAVSDEKSGRKLTYGFGIDQTRDIRNRTFTLASAIAGEALGGTQATGNKFSFESDIAYTAKIGSHPYTLETEGIFSNFSRSKTNVGGGYVQGQFSIFDTEKFGDLDPFIRYDFVRLSRQTINGGALQQAFRAGINYNLPYTRKLANFHIEYVRNKVNGPIAIVPVNRSFNEFRFELRFSITRYTRH